MSKEITSENFKSEVLDYKGKVLVDFWAVWCGPCQMMMPVMEELSAENPDIKICKINVDEQPTLAAQYKVSSIPMFAAFQNGELKGKTVGVSSKEELLGLF